MEGHFLRDGGGCAVNQNKRPDKLVAQLQLKDVIRATSSGLHGIEHLNLQNVSNETELLKRQMLSEFVPRPPKRERRMKPVFHEKDQYLTRPRVTAHSAVDPASSIALDSRTRRYPYLNKRLVTTADLKKPHISSLGVIPVRSSAEIPFLRVVLEGVPAAAVLEEE
ncbi:unnamed protein product, partial [Candidula unifasciata]